MQHKKARENQQCTFMEMRNKGPRNTPQQPPQAQGTMVIHHGRPTMRRFLYLEGGAGRGGANVENGQTDLPDEADLGRLLFSSW